MKATNVISNKFFNLKELEVKCKSWKNNNNKIVFTNGCFDLVHRGHIEILAGISELGDKLIIGLNSDSSIKKLKGEKRPIIDEYSRKLLLAGLFFVDAIIIFDEDTPYELIDSLRPDVLAKGGDYQLEDIVGYDIVKKYGGETITIPFIPNFSSSNIIDKIKNI
ncbi:MAG: D-glycero-beta-D-manno-heptose 1-phosphate adenylyltransferase [Bacteroidota bacterium]|nr:D-glycero-beta-D-manno-heptose 1-phosphate adenylyltransferase [Bacteroidota bacterium]